MKHILLIQFRTDDSRVHEQVCFHDTFYPMKNVRVTAVSSLDGDLVWKEPERILEHFDGVIFGGSGEFYLSGNGHKDTKTHRNFRRSIRNVTPLARYVVARDIPSLGICFGHQLLSSVLGTPVVRDPKQAKKAGVYEVRLTEEGKRDILFRDVPEVFFAQYAHKESLAALPEGATLLAHNGARCRTSAFRYGKSVYGVQFHPELMDKDFLFRLKISDAECMGKRVKTRPTEDARRVLINFVQHVVKLKKK